ncbi:MAG: hypothetical protein ABI042_03115 [Verrucomicrobiota bacterium]
MNKVIFIGFLLGILGLAKLSAATSDDLLASYHFVGTASLAGDPNAARLKRISALPATIALREDVVRKLARASVKILGGDAANTNVAGLLVPIFNDLLTVESAAEIHGKTNAAFFIAARVDAAHSRIWETNLLSVTKAVKPAAVKSGQTSGWQANLNGGRMLRFYREGNWTFVFAGGDQAESQAGFMKRVTSGHPAGTSKSWLEADINWTQLEMLWPHSVSPLKPARMEIKIQGRGGEDLRTTVRMIYAEKIDWKPAPWKIPTNVIRDPLISFTAARNIAPFLKSSLAFQQMKFNPLSQQVFFWALSQMPFQSYVAMPVNDPTNTVKILGPQMMTAFNETLKKREGGRLEISTNKIDLVWKELPPFVAPHIGPDATNRNLLLGGIFPLVPGTNQPPKELFQQVSSRNEIVFYDWEITEVRLSQWQVLSQIFPFFPKELVAIPKDSPTKTLAPARVPERKWLTAIAPLLGNTITEVSFKAPNELNMVRKSHLGLNSVELIFLSHWLAHPDFPMINPFATVRSPSVSSGASAKPKRKP